MAVGIDLGKIVTKPSSGSLNGELADIELFNQCGPVAYHEPHGLNYAPAAKPVFYLPGDQQALITVVMQDPTELLDIGFRQCLRNLLHYGIANGIGMAEPFAFDDFDIILARRRSRACFNMNARRRHGKLPLT